MRAIHRLIFLLVALLAFTACEHDKPQFIGDIEAHGIDPDSFRKEHHYWANSNFVITDTLRLYPALLGHVPSIFNPEEHLLEADDNVVVVDVALVPRDTIDSVWVKVAVDAEVNGWVRESALFESTVPDHQISRFIHEFSDHRVYVLFCILSIAFVLFSIQYYRRTPCFYVHFRDIPSFYPTLLTLVVSTSAALYGTLQRFYPDEWTAYYFAPTLNPFGHAPILMAFLFSVWGILLVLIAVIEDLRKQPDIVDVPSYFSILMGVCMLLYFVFTNVVAYDFGYALLVIYQAFALRRHLKHNRVSYRCGHCGSAIRQEGRCPHCGAINHL